MRNRTHWNSANIKPVDPVTLGLSTQMELDALVKKAADKKAATTAQEGGGPEPEPAPSLRPEASRKMRWRPPTPRDARVDDGPRLPPLSGRLSAAVDARRLVHLFLQLELLSLEFLEPDVVRGGPAHFVLNRVFQGLVAGSEFTDPGFQRHDVWPPCCWIPGTVNTRYARLSDHDMFAQTVGRRSRPALARWGAARWRAERAAKAGGGRLRRFGRRLRPARCSTPAASWGSNPTW